MFLTVDQTVHDADGNRSVVGNLGDNVIDHGDEHLAVTGAIDDPHVVRGGLHDLHDGAERPVSIIDDLATEKVIESDIERIEIDVLRARENVAADELLRTMKVMGAGERDTAAIEGRATDSTDTKRSRSRAGGVRATRMPSSTTKGRPGSEATTTSPFDPWVFTTRAMFL